MTLAAESTRSPRRWATWLELALVAGLFVLYLASFRLESPVNAMEEIFDQDSAHILHALHEGRTYPWNPQHHVLYHQLVELGYRAWARGPVDLDSTYRYLKLFAAITGLAFLLVLRMLFRDIGLDTLRRTTLIALAGLGIASWAAFATIESYGLALPFLALYLATLHRMLRRGRASNAERVGLIVALVGCALARIELAGLILATGVAGALPGFVGLRRTLPLDLVVSALLACVLTLGLTSDYLDVSWRRAAHRIVARGDRTTLGPALMRADNLSPAHLARVGRAASVYALVMPVGRTPRIMDIEGRKQLRYFSEPLATLLRGKVSALALIAALGLLATTLLRALRHAARGDPLVQLILSLWLGGWILYTWFNSVEPYLWIFPFHVLTLATMAIVMRADRARSWAAVGASVVLIGWHNALAFYWTFR